MLDRFKSKKQQHKFSKGKTAQQAADRRKSNPIPTNVVRPPDKRPIVKAA